MLHQHPSCQCTFALLEQVSPIFAPEAVAQHHYNPQQLSQSLTTAQYTYPATNRFLLRRTVDEWYSRDQTRIPEVTHDVISVTDTGLNLRCGARGAPFYQTLNDERITSGSRCPTSPGRTTSRWVPI